MNEDIVINKEAINPMIGPLETQIILQRHCSYDKQTGELLENSQEEQKNLVKNFLHDLQKQNLENTYFLFLASDTFNANSEKKRCVDTTQIVLASTEEFLKNNGILTSHILNLDESLYYHNEIKQTKNFAEPKMFLDNTGYLEFLLEKNGGMNRQFWIDFENDTFKSKREELKAEGPDEIVARGARYIEILQRFSTYFHTKKPNSRLFIWCGTHYDFISPFAKQAIFHYEKSDTIGVDYCGGISIKMDAYGTTTVNVNGENYLLCLEDIKQPHRHL